MGPVIESLLLLIVSLAVLLFFGPIIVIISIIGHIELGSYSLDLRDKGLVLRAVIAIIGTIVWLVIYIPLISLALRSTSPDSVVTVVTPTPQPTVTFPPTSTIPTDVISSTLTPDFSLTPVPDSDELDEDVLDPNELDEVVHDVTDMQMVRVPPGAFWMGSSHSEIYDFHPTHRVFISEFYITKYEVTNLQYAECVDAGVCSTPVLWRSNFRDHYYENPHYDNFPVIYVTWSNADIFCRWRGGRLPTEAEWEKAARWDPVNNQSFLYPWGNNRPTLTLVNFLGTDTTEVGSYPLGASSVGALDMAGNVMEWVADYYARNYYEISPARDPRGPQTPTDKRVARGGRWNTVNDADLWAIARYSFEEETSRNDLGFRCASDFALP